MKKLTKLKGGDKVAIVSPSFAASAVWSHVITEQAVRVNAFVYQLSDNEPKFLCIKRVPEDGGFWQTVTGTVHKNESLVDTIRREIKEECGIGAENIMKIEGPLYEFKWKKGEMNIQEFVYAVEVKNGLKVYLSANEHDDYRWCDGELLLKRLEKEDNIKAANVILEHLSLI